MSDGFNASISASTRLCAVLGHPISHSASPAMQNAGIGHLGLDWRYVAFDVAPNNLKAAIEGAKTMHFVGLNLTVPHKLLALELVDVVDPRAQAWGAVNTVVFETLGPNGLWIPIGQFPGVPGDRIRSHGFNTDADAIIHAIKEEFQWADLRNATILISGAGGAARAAALRLAQEGIRRLCLVNRTLANAMELGGVISGRYPAVQVSFGYPSFPVDLAVNATSLGLKGGDSLPLDPQWLKANRPKRAYDLIYRPRETAFLQMARELGCETSNGLGMLLHQGAEALRLWTGCPPPVAQMRAALIKHVHE